MKKLQVLFAHKQLDQDSRIARVEEKIERNLEYQKCAHERFMDEVLSKEEYLELKQTYKKENKRYQKELLELWQEEQRRQADLDETRIWLEQFGNGIITVKHLTREVLMELVDEIYVYPDQKLDIYFNFSAEVEAYGTETVRIGCANRACVRETNGER